MLLIREETPFKLITIIETLAEITAKQPLKYIKIKFTNQGLSFASFDDSQTIKTGFSISPKIFPVYVCEKDIFALLPVHKLLRILRLYSESDNSLTITYEEPFNVIQFRLYSTSKNTFSLGSEEKTVIALSTTEKFGEMVSEKYEEPENPLHSIEQFSLRPNNYHEEFSHFTANTKELLSILSEFGYGSVTELIKISFESEFSSNKKYISFSGQTSTGIKVITLNEEKEALETNSLAVHSNNQFSLKVENIHDLNHLFRVGDIVRFAVFEENVKIYILEGGLYFLFRLIDGLGEIGVVISPVTEVNVN